MTAVTYKGRTSGRSYSIGPQIARGGEGVVYARLSPKYSSCNGLPIQLNFCCHAEPIT